MTAQQAYEYGRELGVEIGQLVVNEDLAEFGTDDYVDECYGSLESHSQYTGFAAFAYDMRQAPDTPTGEWWIKSRWNRFEDGFAVGISKRRAVLG